MVSPKYAHVFCETSVWMALPLVSAVRNAKPFLAGALMLTLVASTLHRRQLAQSHEANAVWHNLDRLGVVLVLSQVHVAFWPPLALLFAAGATLQRMRVQTCVWGGGAGRAPRSVLPLRVQRWHFWCHVLCRYVAFCACCLASGHVPTTFVGDTVGRFWQWNLVPRVVIYSTLYLAHIRIALHLHARQCVFPKTPKLHVASAGKSEITG